MLMISKEEVMKNLWISFERKKQNTIIDIYVPVFPHYIHYIYVPVFL